MKKKFKNKKKFKDIDEIYVNPNSKILDGSEYKTDIENLKLLFPDFDEDTLYDIYNSKNRNLLLTKNAINEMLNSDSNNFKENIKENINENFINENNDKNYNKNSINHKKKNKKYKGIDITNKSNFIIIGNDEDLKEKENPKEEKKELNSIFDLIKEEQHEMNEKKKKKR